MIYCLLGGVVTLLFFAGAFKNEPQDLREYEDQEQINFLNTCCLKNN